MNSKAPRPICFMVMPFRQKKTDATPGTAPSEIDFDLLWDKAFRPAIEELDYEAVRADQDIGALIIHEMLERLYFADLVLADMTIPNGNVYYEVGIRHASQQAGCVLLAADWSKQLFDLAQNRTVRYPLPVGIIDDAAAEQIRKAIVPAIKKMSLGDSPMYEVLPGYPRDVDPSRATTMRKRLEDLAGFQARVSAVRVAPGGVQRAMLEELIKETPTASVAAVASSLLNLCLELGAWPEILSLIDGFVKQDSKIGRQPQVIELKSLAQSKLGNHLISIGALEQLIKTHGRTSEREGLLGGRYKKLHEAASGPDRNRFLNEAIKHYELGMMADLNDFYPSSNLPRLYRKRGSPEDLAKAGAVAEVVYYACQRAMLSGSANEWLRPTLLGAAFDAGDVNAARTVLQQIEEEGAAQWKIRSTLSDLEVAIGFVEDPEKRDELRAIYLRLEALVPPTTPTA